MSDVIVHPLSVCLSQRYTTPNWTSGGEMPPSLGHPPSVQHPPPTILETIPLRPQTYACGLDKCGDIVGTNATLSYPGEYPKYFDVPFLRNVDWSGYTESKPQPPTPTIFHRVSGPEIAEYFTAKNDEGYQLWSEKKCEEKRRLEKHQKEVSKVPESIRSLPGHHMPSIVQTANQTYGNYLDLLPKYPAVYPLPAKLQPLPMSLEVKLEKSNISSKPCSITHPFVLQPQPAVNATSVAEAAATASSLGVRPHRTRSADIEVTLGKPMPRFNRGETVGERQKGFTFPVYTHTGLEQNYGYLTPTPPPPITTTSITTGQLQPHHHHHHHYHQQQQRQQQQTRFCTAEKQQQQPAVYSFNVPGKVAHAVTLQRQHLCVPYAVSPPAPATLRAHPYPATRRVIYQTVPIPGLLC